MSKNNTPLVSVLIPVYNGTHYLDAAINSVLKSTYKNYEIILVDDGSTDASRKKCQAFAKKSKKIRFFGFSKNQGMTRCLNFGVKKAKGKYIARINQDDVMVANRLEKQVRFFENHPNHVVLGGAIQLFTDDNPKFDKIKFPLTDSQIRAQWMLVSPYADPTVMYRKSAWEKTNGYSQYFWPADDVHMWYQLGKIGKMANLASVLTKVGWHESCGSIRSHRKQMQKTWQVHIWAAEMIQKPKIHEVLFWISQLIAGHLFSAEFNWAVYRNMRRLQVKMLKARKGELSLSKYMQGVYTNLSNKLTAKATAKA